MTFQPPRSCAEAQSATAESDALSDAMQATIGLARQDPRREDLIGRHLRQVYNQTLREPLPTQFMDLLSRLDG